MKKDDCIFIAGHNGMVGSAILNSLKNSGFTNIITASFGELDLRNQQATLDFFTKNTPKVVINAAAKVGGIKANMTYPAQFLYDNLMIQANIYESARLCGTEKILFLGSSCVYPKDCPQPIKEEYLLTGLLEPTNEGYALAKIAGIKLAEFYYQEYGINSLSLMPSNLYGENDSFDLEHSHVLSALVRRFSEATEQNQKEITLWGTGIARREFMNVADCANAVLFFLENIEKSNLINIGWGKDISIKELAEKIAQNVGFKGEILWDHSKPDGMLRKCLDVSKMSQFGFKPVITLNEGISQMIAEFNKFKGRNK